MITTKEILEQKCKELIFLSFYGEKERIYFFSEKERQYVALCHEGMINLFQLIIKARDEFILSDIENEDDDMPLDYFRDGLHDYGVLKLDKWFLYTLDCHTQSIVKAVLGIDQ